MVSVKLSDDKKTKAELRLQAVYVTKMDQSERAIPPLERVPAGSVRRETKSSEALG